MPAFWRTATACPSWAYAAPSLAPSLTLLQISRVRIRPDAQGAAAVPFLPGDLDFLGALTRLERLELHGLPRDSAPAPAWLAQLTELTFLDAGHFHFSASRMAETLAPLRGLRALRIGHWSAEERDAPRALPACGVTKLSCGCSCGCHLSLRPDLAASLAAAFPCVQQAEVVILRVVPAPPPPLPGVPRWSDLRRLAIFSYVDAPVIIRVLQALGALGGSLRCLMVQHWRQQPGEQPARAGDAELLAILASAPGLEELSLDTEAITDGAFALCPRLASLKCLLLCGYNHDTRSLLSPRFSAAGLLALGAAFPALEKLMLGRDETERAWARQLDALGAGTSTGGTLPSDAASHVAGLVVAEEGAQASRCRWKSFFHDWSSVSGRGQHLLRAIRGAQQRGAVAVGPATPAQWARRSSTATVSSSPMIGPAAADD
jgi:hypothetical protein